MYISIWQSYVNDPEIYEQEYSMEYLMVLLTSKYLKYLCHMTHIHQNFQKYFRHVKSVVCYHH